MRASSVDCHCPGGEGAACPIAQVVQKAAKELRVHRTHRALALSSATVAYLGQPGLEEVAKAERLAAPEHGELLLSGPQSHRHLLVARRC